MSKPIEVIAYTDGGCEPNPGTGGWGFLLVHLKSGVALAGRGGQENTTNNKMEFRGAIQALRALKRRTVIEIRSDSQYLVNTMTKWVEGWKSRGWRKGDGKTPKNLGIVQELYQLCNEHEVYWTWVRGHSGDPANEYVDRLAAEAISVLFQGQMPQWQERMDRPPVKVEGVEL